MSVWELTVAVAHGREEADRCGVTESPRELLESVWNDTASELSRLASAMGLPVERVQDVLQDVYLVGLQKCPRVVGRDELRRWLFRVTVNRCNLEHRRGRRWQAVLKNLAPLRPTSSDRGVEAATWYDDERRMVAEGLKALDPVLKSVLVLRYFIDLNSKEIGCILDLPDSTVRSRLRKARRQLATALKQMGCE